MEQKSVILLLLFTVIYLLDKAMVASIKCYSYHKTSIKPEDLPKADDLTQATCTSPNDGCEVRVIRLKKTKMILEVDLKCSKFSACQLLGTGCNTTVQADRDYCGRCCQKDFCNTPEIAKFESNQAQESHINWLVQVMAFATVVVYLLVMQ